MICATSSPDNEVEFMTRHKNWKIYLPSVAPATSAVMKKGELAKTSLQQQTRQDNQDMRFGHIRVKRYVVPHWVKKKKRFNFEHKYVCWFNIPEYDLIIINHKAAWESSCRRWKDNSLPYRHFRKSNYSCGQCKWGTTSTLNTNPISMFNKDTVNNHLTISLIICFTSSFVRKASKTL